LAAQPGKNALDSLPFAPGQTVFGTDSGEFVVHVHFPSDVQHSDGCRKAIRTTGCRMDAADICFAPKLDAKLTRLRFRAGGAGRTLLQRRENLLGEWNIRLPSARNLKNRGGSVIDGQYVQPCIEQDYAIDQTCSGPWFRSAFELGLTGAHRCHLRTS